MQPIRQRRGKFASASEMGRELTVSGLDLCVDFDAAVGGYHVLGDRDAFVDRDALVDDCVVLHAGMGVSLC